MKSKRLQRKVRRCYSGPERLEVQMHTVALTRYRIFRQKLYPDKRC